jgi:tRNA-(ms[2]io[6]A)-hydroxylase
MADTPKKRVQLTVLQQSDPDGAAGAGEGRSPGAWVVLGAMATITMVVLFGSLAAFAISSSYGGVGGNVPPQAGNAVALAGVVVIAISSGIGGYLVGRWGGKAGPREAALSGLVAGSFLWLLSIKGLPAGLAAMTGVGLVLVAVPCAYRGGRTGIRARRPGDM